MPLTLIPRDTPERLIERLGRLGGRLRRVTILRDCARLLVAVVLFMALVGWLDWRLGLPPLVRALALVAAVVGAALYFRWAILRPLRGSGDPLRMAMRVEAHYPTLNDSLASAVQFLQMGEDDNRSSSELRRETIRQAAAEAGQYDLDAAVDSRGVGTSLLALIITAVGIGWLLGARFEVTLTAAKRFAFPFAALDWPTQTRIEFLDPLPSRIARGEALDLRVALDGVIPDRAQLTVWLDGGTTFEQVYAIPRDDAHAGPVVVRMRVEATRLPRSFRFQVRAHDAATRVHAVTVAPPPALVPRDGRASPQIHLDYPAYTELPPVELPDGTGLIEAVAGTRVTLWAATDRPVTRASIAFRPDQARLDVAAALAPLGGEHCLGTAATWVSASEAWREVPAQISGAGMDLFVSFVPRLRGTYALRFEDETSLGATRLLECRIFPDPKPSVLLDRPSASKDPLVLLPDADVPVSIRATDKLFGLRDISLEYRMTRAGASCSIPMASSDGAEVLLPELAGLMRGPLLLPNSPRPHLRPQSLAVHQQFSLGEFRHANGKALAEGDMLILRAAASDFDDVTGQKEPGRSHEVEIQIVSRSDLDALLQQAQSNLRGELLKLRDRQREARSQVREALVRQRTAGSLAPQDIDRLLQAEQLQQQVRARVNAPEDGLRAELQRLRRTIDDNKLPRSATSDRIETTARELERLATEELDPIEPLIAEGRKEQRPGAPARGGNQPLARAERHQQEVEETLQALLERLEPWSAASEVRGEARSLLGELRRASEQSRRLEGTIPLGAKLDRLTPEQRAELEKAAARQDRLAEEGRQLTEKLDRITNERDQSARERLDLAERNEREANSKAAEADAAEKGSPESRALRRAADDLRAAAEQARQAGEALRNEADALAKAAEAAEGEKLGQALRQAASDLRNNNSGRAGQMQEAAAGNLQRMIDALNEGAQEDGDRLAKKMRAAAERLNGLTEEQERLQKKVEAAKAIADPQERRDELKKLAREQERLERQARELAQQLSGARTDEAAQQLRRAARAMEDARDQLEQGEPGDAAQDQALDRLDDASDGLDRARDRNDEELLREKMSKLADQLKALRDRQGRALDESQRIHDEVAKPRAWSRPLLASLKALLEQQRALASEVVALAQTRFAQQRVFDRMLRHAAEEMENAGRQIDERCQDVIDQLDQTTTYQADLEEKSRAAIVSRQRLALKRLDQVLEALKPDKEMAQARRGQNGQANGGNSGSARAGGSDVPPLAQLKALRALQAEVLERTEAFDKSHPDRSHLDDDASLELRALEKAQREVAELFQGLADSHEPGEEP
jgi:hypothetical protein